ncbi:D-alanyl-glycyl endopeptidase-like protein [Trypanosoma rangeli]|uniref:D-alanyl-glycyl endopeptidase-like protein n=1 Tax=Trypanosoma rangeli TaxID=5698 RepID=A0A3R7LYQ4_TRYRA|nr:D-alanyl-glycyl endopeptidase-like protein [Trypanosoma rangeli]RNF05922.1 D-alanyl-glycyl endopeptidase-like protein [Trypanosoma rangeli]|eukprot:RNF05922.1 D-alanyl-glycyl endopeptidase-like protein [Trypanosoma rangeli]
MDTTVKHTHLDGDNVDRLRNPNQTESPELRPRGESISNLYDKRNEDNEIVSEHVEIQSNETEDVLRKKFSRVNATLTLVAGWLFALLTLLFLTFIVFGILYSGIHYHGAGWHDPSTPPNCTTPFGAIIGVTNGVFAYSNCNDMFTGENNNALVDKDKSTTGLKWQCVEFARRYWMLRGSPVPASFATVEGAADIWALTSVQLLNGSTTPLLKYANGVSVRAGGSAPRIGDLLVYPKQGDGFPFGHVAVVVSVKSESLLVAEQNWDNNVWPAPHHDYSREIPMHHNVTEDTYKVIEADNVIVTGWVRYAK